MGQGGGGLRGGWRGGARRAAGGGEGGTRGGEKVRAMMHAALTLIIGSQWHRLSGGATTFAGRQRCDSARCYRADVRPSASCLRATRRQDGSESGPVFGKYLG